MFFLAIVFRHEDMSFFGGEYTGFYAAVLVLDGAHGFFVVEVVDVGVFEVVDDNVVGMGILIDDLIEILVIQLVQGAAGAK